MMAHDFERFPELTNGQMQFYYFESPHKQIFEPFTATVVKVHDGDTLTVRWDARDFDFPVRFSNIAAPELSQQGGKEARSWLESFLLGHDVDIIVDPNNRVEKFGRLLGKVYFMGIDVGQQEISLGLAKPWELRNEGVIEWP